MKQWTELDQNWPDAYNALKGTDYRVRSEEIVNHCQQLAFYYINDVAHQKNAKHLENIEEEWHRKMEEQQRWYLERSQEQA